MVKYARDALALLVCTFSFENAMCWSIGPNSPGTRILDQSHAITDLKRIPSLTSLYAVDPGSSSSIVSDTISSSVSAITENSESMLSPLRIALTQILEKETSLDTLDKSSTSNLVQTLLSMIDTFDSMLHSLKAVANDFPTEAINTIFLTSVESAKTYATSIDETLLSSPLIGPVLTSIQNAVAMIIPIIGQELASLPPSVGLLASFTISYTIISTVQSMGKGPPLSSPYPLGRYDSSSARIYFRSRLGEMAARATEIGARSGEFGLALLGDAISDKLVVNADIRAQQLSTLLTTLGPSFIKIGQSLSIRTDLLSPAYVRGLKSLQDQVPAFPTDEAREIIEEELGVPVDSIFSDFSAEPVAAASLGQVYKAKLRSNGKEVAIKVQRPGIMNQIAVDMHILREVAPVLRKIFNLNTNLPGIIDTWGSGFVDELDYISEAENAEYFTESIQSTPLSEVVFAPPIVEECTTGKVLTTEWVDGVRLDKSSNEDVTILCSIAMNTYLTMMLETGVLHCDPHPGNLLRTPDGKLCILDWGMVTKLDKDLQVTLIEHMAHLTSADYGEIPRDLLLLGFIPKDKADLIEDSGIVEVLADIYGAWTKGGGAASVNVNEVIANLQDLTAKKGNLFQIPPYFAYIAKSFSVLEGIGLSNDQKYSIINECLPYISKRLLTDQSQRTGGALSTFIFGPSKNDFDSRIVDYDRVEQLINGFGEYSTSTSGAQLGQDRSRTELIDEFTDQALDLLVTEKETPLQTIFIEQVAKVISSSSRLIWTNIREGSGRLSSGRTVLGTLVDPLGLFRTSPIVRMNELDERTMETTSNLISLLGEQVQTEGNNALDTSSLSPAETQEILSTLVRKVWERRNGFLKTGNRLATKLLQLTADKLEAGERDVLVLPKEDLPSTQMPTETVQNTRLTESPSSDNTSSRMLHAQQILQDVEQQEVSDKI
eukprot:CAMPEP_0198261370 /NCGR_PEP_ID=MMETSP1447-20131203/10115_1 /TAXON_ID=420782 /ORGANISM="Chaetoceros dichaeta, Strain CCMP1751" /LENGTH=942 /DNA_ID=CAMNT_0043949269 /DNA_START=8 /DNA_END=2836 /DNA_ORIENTATION=-